MNPPQAPTRHLRWPHGEAELSRLGAMLGPVSFRAEGRPDFQPLQIAPWADEPGADALPGILRRLRGDWPCVPFGRTDRPAGLPADWLPLTPDDAHGHGFAANHDWEWLPADDPLELRLGIDCPATSAVRRLERRVRARPDEPALDLSLRIEVRREALLPVALHPVLRLDAGRVEIEILSRAPGHTYPVPCEPGVSRLAADRAFASLCAVPLAEGGTLDLARYPLPFDTEELLQLRDIAGPAVARFIDLGWALALDWDRRLLPDATLWVSHRGRTAWPWLGRHLGLGIEPVNGPFDLGRVAVPPPGHPVARHGGIALSPGEPCVIASSLVARPLGSTSDATSDAPAG